MSSSSGSDCGASDDIDALTAEEYLEHVGTEELIDRLYSSLARAQPNLDELVAVVAQLIEANGEGHHHLEQPTTHAPSTLLSGPAEGSTHSPPTPPRALGAGLSAVVIPADESQGGDEASYVRAVEAALVEAVRSLAEERPFEDEAPICLANNFRVAAARLPTPPASPAHTTLSPATLPSHPPQQPGTSPHTPDEDSPSSTTPSKIKVTLFEPQGEEELCQEPRQEDVEHVQRSADLGQRRVVKEEVVKSPESAGAGSMGSTLRTGTVNQQLAPLGILNLRK